MDISNKVVNCNLVLNPKNAPPPFKDNTNEKIENKTKLITYLRCHTLKANLLRDRDKNDNY